MNARRTRFRIGFIMMFACAMTLAGRSAFAQTSITAVAAELGITPQSAVIANLSSTQASQVLAHLQGAGELRQLLIVKHQAVDEAAAAVTEFSQLLLTDSGNEEVLGQYETAKEVLTAAREHVVEVQVTLFEIAVVGIGAEKVAMINVCRSGARYRVQSPLRAKQRTVAQWKTIEPALRAESRANRRGEDLNEDIANLLAQVRADQEVIEAEIHLNQNLELMKQIFAQYD
ncbi:MAG: hypothetical protein IH984_17570 [Planctomycetes bacterium]|nr:hypothetical protein [Planctomycetota bacterium]